MKINYSLWLVLLVVALLSLSGCLFKQGVSYRQKNRELLLQNDSLISVNIELKRKLEQVQTDSVSENSTSGTVSIP